MIILYPTGIVTAFFGRSPTYINETYSNWGVAPHAFTGRFSYTVPAGRAAVITAMAVYVQRSTVATTLGLVDARLSITIDLVATQILVAELQDNNIGASKQNTQGGQVFLAAGYMIAAETVDLSTGGTVNYFLSIHGVEYTP